MRGSKKLTAIFRELCWWKGISIIETEICLNHIHMLLEIPPKCSVSSIMGYLKGKSSLSMYEGGEKQNSDIETESLGVKGAC